MENGIEYLSDFGGSDQNKVKLTILKMEDIPILMILCQIPLILKDNNTELVEDLDMKAESFK